MLRPIARPALRQIHKRYGMKRVKDKWRLIFQLYERENNSFEKDKRTVEITKKSTAGIIKQQTISLGDFDKTIDNGLLWRC